MSSNMPVGAAIGLLGLVIVCGGGYELAKANYHDHTAVCTITDKDRGTASGERSSSHYRIYTDQCGTLANEDIWLRGKFNSGDIQGKLQRGHTYRIRIVGWRNGMTSDFPNILTVDGEVQR